MEGNDESGWKGGEVTDFEATRFWAWSASFSPDGRWLAYSSDESGPAQVFVQRFPGGGGKKKISVERVDAPYPFWSGQELIFQSVGNGVGSQILVTDYSVKDQMFLPNRPAPWEGGPFNFGENWDQGYALHLDGNQVLIKTRLEGEKKQIFDQVILFENFLDYLREQVPTGKN